MKVPSSIIYHLLVPLCIAMLVSCSKGSNVTKPTPPATKTTTQLLVSAPWKISNLSFINTTTLTPYGVPTPDSLLNLVLTFGTDNTFTETGGKTASGTWAFNKYMVNVITLTTTTIPTSIINWTFTVTTTQLGLSNTAIIVTYINPANPLQYYQGEEVDFIH